MAPNEFDIEDVMGFQASLRAAEMWPAQVSALTYSSLRSSRTPKLIRRSDPDEYAVGLILRGRQGLVQDRREAAAGAGDLIMYSDSRPYQAIVEAHPSLAATVVVRIPRSALPLPAARVDRLLASPLPGREGIGGLLSGFLTRVTTDASPYDRADNHRLGVVLLDLLTAWLARHLDAEQRTPAETRERVQFLQVQSFVLSHLGDPDLSPGAIAAAHHLSLRTLHRLFQRQGLTVAAFIRHQRLTRAARDLADPHLAVRPVYAIAATWGFGRAADFTRAFRAAYGMAPTDYRRSRIQTTPQTRR
jgi:AraC-like DNA-binding protein